MQQSIVKWYCFVVQTLLNKNNDDGTYRPTVYAISVSSIITGDTPVLQGFIGYSLDRLPACPDISTVCPLHSATKPVFTRLSQNADLPSCAVCDMSCTMDLLLVLWNCLVMCLFCFCICLALCRQTPLDGLTFLQSQQICTKRSERNIHHRLSAMQGGKQYKNTQTN
jgi:hypothetical protein